MSSVKVTADSGGGSVALNAPSSTTSNADVVLTLPANDGDASQYLQTNGSGALSWATVSAGLTWNSYTRTAAQLNGNNAITVTGLDGSEIKRLWFIGTNMSNDGSSGNNALCCRIGDSGGLEDSGYTTTIASVGSHTGGAQSTGAWDIGNGSGGGSDLDCFTFTLVPTNTDGTGWVCEWHHGQQNSGTGGTWMNVGVGAKELSAELDRISFYWLSSHDFDSGFGQVFWLT